MKSSERVIPLLGILFLYGVSAYAVWRLPMQLSGHARWDKPVLTVLTRNAPTTFYQDSDGPAGPEYDLAGAFAGYLGLRLEIKQYHSVAQILDGLKNGQADLAAAALSPTEKRRKDYLFGPAYQTVSRQVVCRLNAPMPDSLENLPEVQIKVTKNSSYEEILMNLRERHLPKLTWQSSDEPTEQLLEQVWEKQLDCTIADSNIVDINRRYYPELRVAFDLGKPLPLAWFMPLQNKRLQLLAQRWFQDFQNSGQWEQVMARYYAHIPVFDYVDMAVYHRRIGERLPRYRELFEEAGGQYRLPWTLLAAQAYQESHWHPKAKSPTGVRGIMMLTRRTARTLGISNRLDARQSIMGGAKYLAALLERIPESIAEDERMRFALAAYNIGWSHLQDARQLAAELNKNPDSWLELSEVLPLLAQEKYHSKLRHGYARGTEPVRYVQRIYDYLDILEQIVPKES